MNSISFDKAGITFEVGKEYENALGTYKVLAISDEGKLHVEYVSVKGTHVVKGQRANYDAEGQAISMKKMKMEVERPSLKRIHKRLHKNTDMNEVTDSRAFIIGYLARNAYIQICVGPTCMETFPQDFKVVTGKDVNEFTGKGYLSDPKMNKYSYSMSIILPVPASEVLKLIDGSKHYIIKDKTMYINNNDLVWALLNVGFLPGRNDKNDERILSKLAIDKWYNFNLGWEDGHEKET